MDKYEFNIKIEQMRKLVNRGDYETAMKIADTIDWKKVRNANLLSMVATIYEKNGEYQDSKDILLLAFERAPIGKRLLYKLTDLALKEGNIKEAEDYYREFCDLAGDDPRQQLLRYKILKQMNAPLEQQIHSLESYNAEELDEKWLYELAELYQKAGNAERCVATCDKIMLMFGLGKYVDKAMELKVQYAPLNKYQTDLVENRDKYEEKLRAVEQSFASGDGMASLEMENDSDEVDDADLLPDEQFEENEEAVAEVENTVMDERDKTAETVESVQAENQVKNLIENQVQVPEKAEEEAVASVETVDTESAKKAEQTATKKTEPVAVVSAEAADVDGANGFVKFIKITMPYMLFVTAPYLITTFTANINNFNIVYLLTKGDPVMAGATAGKTDLLVTWLYKMTIDYQYYNLGAVIGIMTFIFLAIGSLLVYRRTKAYKDEEGFQ